MRDFHSLTLVSERRCAVVCVAIAGARNKITRITNTMRNNFMMNLLLNVWPVSAALKYICNFHHLTPVSARSCAVACAIIAGLMKETRNAINAHCMMTLLLNFAVR